MFFFSSQENEGEDRQQGDVETEKAAGKKEEAAEEEFLDILPPSPQDIRESIKQKFLVDMPEDFYLFYDFCKVRNP
jgi:hypothetical protein